MYKLKTSKIQIYALLIKLSEYLVHTKERLGSFEHSGLVLASWTNDYIELMLNEATVHVMAPGLDLDNSEETNLMQTFYSLPWFKYNLKQATLWS